MASLEEHVENLDSEVVKLLKKYKELKIDKDNKKIKCSLSGHEMPCTPLAITTYVSGKKFNKLRQKKEYNYDEHKTHLVPSIKKFHLKHLYCPLTQTHVNDTPADIERHITGRKYKRALAEWKRCQEAGEKFRPFGNLKKQRPDDDDAMSNSSDLTGGGGGILDSDHETDSKKDTEEDNFSDLYPEENEEDMKDGSGSDYDFDAMDNKPKHTIKPKPIKLTKSLNGNGGKKVLPQRKKKVKRLKPS
ncbi:hypothetical protein SNE40_000556 [Patella caerulea]|uniref:Surfeit locus protein 2 n=1 Tax=Patella caerulea TaxID=87958 RepID=A0AAN8QA47_PATCE